MKLFILIFFPFFSFAQQSTYKPGDSTWIVSMDTGKVKVSRTIITDPVLDATLILYTKDKSGQKHYIENNKGTIRFDNYGTPQCQMFVYDRHTAMWDTLYEEPRWHETGLTQTSFNEAIGNFGMYPESTFNPYDTLPKEIGKWSYKDKHSGIITIYDVLKQDSAKKCMILSGDSRIASYLLDGNKTIVEYKSGEIWEFTNDGSKPAFKRPWWHRYRAWNVDTTGVEIVTTQEDGVQIFGEDSSSGYTIGYNTVDSAWLADVRIYTSKPAEYTYDEVYYGRYQIKPSEHWVIRDPKTGEWKESDKNGKIIHTPQSKEIYRRENGKPYIDKPKYDTIGPVWKLISHTGPGYNPAMAAQVYEVRVYKNEWVTVDPNRHSADGYSTTLLGTLPQEKSIPHHFGWLGVDKKPLQYKVWEYKTSEP